MCLPTLYQVFPIPSVLENTPHWKNYSKEQWPSNADGQLLFLKYPIFKTLKVVYYMMGWD